MPKDYAKYIKQPKRPLTEHGWRKRLLFTIIFLFVILSTGYSYFIYKHYQHTTVLPSLSVWFKKVTTFSEKNSSTETINKQNPENQNQEADIQFSFYTDLPTTQVSLPSNSEKIIVKKEPQQAETITKLTEINPPVTEVKQKLIENKYLLQLAAFKNPSSASELRISLLLAGVEVDIVKTTQDNQPIYQVQQGPFSSLSQAKFVQKQLKKKGIESIIVKKIA